MPFTPFFGISILVHVSVIIGNIIFRTVHIRKGDKKDRVFALQWLGPIIISLIFTFVLISAGIMVHSSIVEKHSSVIFLSSLFDDLIHKKIYTQPVIDTSQLALSQMILPQLMPEQKQGYEILKVGASSATLISEYYLGHKSIALATLFN